MQTTPEQKKRATEAPVSRKGMDWWFANLVGYGSFAFLFYMAFWEMLFRAGVFLLIILIFGDWKEWWPKIENWLKK